MERRREWGGQRGQGTRTQEMSRYAYVHTRGPITCTHTHRRARTPVSIHLQRHSSIADVPAPKNEQRKERAPGISSQTGNGPSRRPGTSRFRRFPSSLLRSGLRSLVRSPTLRTVSTRKASAECLSGIMTLKPPNTCEPTSGRTEFSKDPHAAVITIINTTFGACVCQQSEIQVCLLLLGLLGPISNTVAIFSNSIP